MEDEGTSLKVTLTGCSILSSLYVLNDRITMYHKCVIVLNILSQKGVQTTPATGSLLLYMYMHVLEVILCVGSAIKTSWSQTLVSAATLPHIMPVSVIVNAEQPPQILQCKEKRKKGVCVEDMSLTLPYHSCTATFSSLTPVCLNPTREQCDRVNEQMLQGLNTELEIACSD